MLLSDLYCEIADSVRVHHASGHFTHAEAQMRLSAQTGCDETEASRILAAYVPERLYDEFKGVPAWRGAGAVPVVRAGVRPAHRGAHRCLTARCT